MFKLIRKIDPSGFSLISNDWNRGKDEEIEIEFEKIRFLSSLDDTELILNIWLRKTDDEKSANKS